jgi:stearoyl-CoA desaturase (delta-9 desaturase)
MKLNDIHKLIATVLIVHFLAIVGIVMLWDPAWLWLSFFAHIMYLWFGHDLYHHRFLSHRSFDMPIWMQRICAVLGIYCLFGTAIGIAATHVSHHKYSDTDRDPHPAHYGFKSWFWLHEGMNNRDRSTIARLSKDEFLKFIGKHYYKIYFLTILLVCFVDVKIAVYGFFIPVVYSFFSNGLVNVICHRYGYRTYETKDKSCNNLFVNLMLFGSGIAMHNTHHAYPNRYKLSNKLYEVDLVGALISLIKNK